MSTMFSSPVSIRLSSGTSRPEAARTARRVAGAEADGEQVLRGDARRQRGLDRPGPVVVQAGRGAAVIGAEAQHHAFLVRLHAVDAAAEPHQEQQADEHREAAPAAAARRQDAPQRGLGLPDQVIEVGPAVRCPGGPGGGVPHGPPGRGLPHGLGPPLFNAMVPVPASAAPRCPLLEWVRPHLGRGGCAGCARPYDTPGRATDTRRGAPIPGWPRILIDREGIASDGRGTRRGRPPGAARGARPGNRARRRGGRHGPGPRGARRAGAVRPCGAAGAGARVGAPAAGGGARRGRRSRRAQRHRGADRAPSRAGGRRRGRAPPPRRARPAARIGRRAGGAGGDAAARGGEDRRRRLRQGRRREVHHRGEPRRRAGRAGPPRGPARRRHLRTLPAADAGRAGAAAHGRPAHHPAPALGPLGHVHRLPGGGGHGR